MDDRMMQTMLELDEQHWWYRGRRRIIRAELQRLPLPAGARVLDAGCGSGRTLEELRDFGEVSGIELSPDAAAVARDRGNFDVRIGRLEEMPWDDGTFDLITCLDVVEHTPDDRATLSELRRVCKPGGWLLVTVPAYQSLWSQFDEENHHYRRYVRGTLRWPAEAAGWSVERMTSFNSLLLAPAAAVRLARRHRRPSNNGEYTTDLQIGPSWLNGVLERPLRIEARWLSRGRTLPVGLSLLGILRNPPT
jgi:SAM-dependent methyltransferase